MALLVAFAQGVEAEEQTTVRIKTEFVRATKYYKTDYKCDKWTLAGKTSTQLNLPTEDKVNNPKYIGNVAVDTDKIPEGSFVFETQTSRFYVCTTGGNAVIDRRAAIELADGSNMKRNALVFDFYSPKEIIENHYTYCWVIPHEGRAFRDLKLTEQKRRLDPKFWLDRLMSIYDSSSSEEEKNQLRIMMNCLREMIR